MFPKIKLKGYKVTDCSRQKLYGVACSSLKDLVIKGCKKLSIDEDRSVTVHLMDGTVVDAQDYFDTIPQQTVLILKQRGEYLPTGADLIYNVLRSVNIDVLRTGEMVEKFFDKKIKEKVKVLNSIVDKTQEASDKTKCSSRDEDPDWFRDLETSAKTKEAFMFRRSQDRIRGYYYKTQADLKKMPEVANNTMIMNVVEDVFGQLKDSLRKDQFFGCYLDRSQQGAMCDGVGDFTCGGVWKNGKCLHEGHKQHIINPYSSREARIIFSTWNLDHCIERSRTVIPALLKASMQAAMNCERLAVNTTYFYSLLFTSSNLRLVHIVCHDKGKHDTANCDPEKCLVPL